ncbi:MAG: peptidylprolyl isomerase [Coriobacteriia bacterium]
MRPIARSVWLAVVLALLLGVAGCSSREVAAEVNGEKVYVDQIEAQLSAIKDQYPQMFQGTDGEAREMDFRARILDNLVVDILQRQAAEEMGIEVSDADVEDQIEKIKSSFPDEESFSASLRQNDMTEEDLRDEVYNQLLTEAIIEEISGDVEVTEEEIQDYYDRNQDQFRQPAAKRAAHILFAADDKETAEQVLQQIRDGADFAAMAKQYSTDPASAENGGDLGWPMTPYVAEFQEALDQLEVGEVSDLVETVFGWHIIKCLDEREESVKTLDEAREEIEAILKQQAQAEAYQQFISELKEKAEIEYFVDYAPAS